MIKNLAARVSYFYMASYAWRFSPNRSRAVQIYILLIIAYTCWLSEPMLMGRAIGALAADSGIKRKLALWLGLATIVALVGGVLHRRGRILQRKYAFEIRRNYETFLYGQLLRFSWGWHQKHHSGDTLSRVKSASTALNQFMNEDFRYIEIFFNLMGSVFLLLILAPSVGLIVGISIPLLLWLLQHYDRKIIEFGENWFQRENHLSAGLSDFIGNIATILSLRLGPASKDELTGRMDSIRPFLHGHIDISQTKWFMFGRAERVISIGALVLYYFTHQHDNRAVLIANIVAVLQYLKLITGTTSDFINTYQGVTSGKIALHAIDDIVEGEVGEDFSTAAEIPWANAKLSNVQFRYEDREHHLHQLDNVSLTLERGGRIALVGASGSGKSTLLRLMRGLHEPLAGSLTLDGTKTGFMTLAELSTLIPQDSEIFENTLRYNITFGTDASNIELQSVIDMACLGPVIDPLPQKLDTDLRERGVNLSGGQKQRVALARGLFAARKSSLLLMDEPTSSLDPITEAEIFTNILNGMPGSCIVAAIHRLHLLDRFDHIYVMQDGRIIEEGPLDKLLEERGMLYQLWQAQTKEENA